MATTALRRKVEAALDELALPGPLTNDRLKAALEEQRGRPIHIQDAPAALFADTACGVWWETEHFDLILVPEDSDAALRAHTIRHEFAHMILRHQGLACGSESMTEVIRQVLPDLDPGKVLGMLNRSDFTGHAEQEAEMLASLLTLRADATEALATAEAEALRQALTSTRGHRG